MRGALISFLLPDGKLNVAQSRRWGGVDHEAHPPTD